jgi:hypothetical protein
MQYERIDEAFAAFHAFVDNIVRSDGIYRAKPDKDMKHWHAIAKMAVDRDITPELLISARFAMTEAPLRRTLRPSNICRPVCAVDSALREFVHDRTRDHRHAYTTAKYLAQSLHLRMPDKTLDQLLEDPNHAFPAWFRIVQSSTISNLLKECYLDEAKEEYRHDVGLQTFIAETLNGLNATRLA